MRIAAEAASEKKATDLVALRVNELLVITDVFLLATGANDRQVSSIVSEIEDQLREKGGVKPIGREGEREARWVLLDYGDFVVHVFQSDERDFYRLEKLWSDAPRIDLSDLEGAAPLPAPADGEDGDAEGPTS